MPRRRDGPIANTNLLGLWVTYVLPFLMLELRYYWAPDDRSPFELWFAALNVQARASRYGHKLIVPLPGGTKKRQQRDSEAMQGFGAPTSAQSDE